MAQTTDFAKRSAKQMRMSYYAQRFIIHPKSILGLKLPVTLNWVRLRFSKPNLKKIARSSGVYAFVIGVDLIAISESSYKPTVSGKRPCCSIGPYPARGRLRHFSCPSGSSPQSGRHQ